MKYSSSATANNSLTHLPFRLTHGRETTAQSAVYEFPVSVEDEAKPPLADRLAQTLALADRLGRYGGLLVVLIHTDVTDQKLEFERRLVEALHRRAWFGTLREFGEFWAARDRVTVDVERRGAQLRIALAAPARVAGLALGLPAGYRVASAEPRELRFTQTGGQIVIDALDGEATLILEASGSAR